MADLIPVNDAPQPLSSRQVDFCKLSLYISLRGLKIAGAFADTGLFLSVRTLPDEDMRSQT